MLGSGAGVRVASPAGAVVAGLPGLPGFAGLFGLSGLVAAGDGADVDRPEEEIRTSGSGPAEGVALVLTEGEGEGALFGRPRVEVARVTRVAVARGVPLARRTRRRSDPRDGAGEPAGERSTLCRPCASSHPIGGSSGPASAPLTSVSVSARTTMAPPTAAAVKILARRPLWSTKTAVRPGR
ncbi:hypothetical protein AB0O28_30185 [Microbispora sp. NPDC088329]|uniref:hypothetical protein n=1 Tax=unclassified Microbispora TaxID=2614687 RepID=UPI00341C183F